MFLTFQIEDQALKDNSSKNDNNKNEDNNKKLRNLQQQQLQERNFEINLKKKQLSNFCDVIFGLPRNGVQKGLG